MKKRIWSILLTLCMVFAMMPMTAYAVSDSPVIISIVASDADSIDGLGIGDTVTITFDHPTNKPTITAATIASKLPLNNGHSWGTNLRNEDIAWNESGNILTITFSSVINSTIAVGDTISLDSSADITYSDRTTVSNSTGIITGSFFPRTFDANITVDGSDVPCKFKVLTEPAGGTSGTIQIGDGDGSAVHISTSGEIAIPASVTRSGIVGSYNVTKIGDDAFSLCYGLTGTLTIPSSVTEIGDSAFINCTGLTGLELTGSVLQTIGASAFNGCTGLTGGLTIPSSVTEIGASAFNGCHGLTGGLTIPSSVTTIGASAFNGCEVLTGLELTGSALQTIGASAFHGCTGLIGDLIIPSSVTTIGASAFSTCNKLTRLELTGSALQTIGAHAFTGCNKLAGSLTIPSSVTTIGEYAFYNCERLNGTLSLPALVNQIGELAFYNCTGLTALELQGNSLPTSMGTNLFYGCSNLDKLFIPATWTGADSVNLSGIDTTFAIGTGNMVKVAGLTSVLGESLSVPESGTGAASGTPITWSIDVANDKAQLTTNDIAAATSSTAILYSNASFDANENAAIQLSPGGETIAYIKVTSTAISSDPVTTRYHKVTINRAADPSGNGNSSGGGSSTPATVTKIESGGNVTATNVDNLVKEGKKLTVEGKTGEKLVFDTEALKNIDGQTKDSVKVEIKDVSTDYKNEHPDRLVVSLTITAGGKHITSFGNGTATVSLPYELKAGEKATDVTVWYLAEDGTMTEVPCTYDPATKLATFKVNHFSLYVVGTADTSTWMNPFSDVKESSWYYDAVRYVSANELMNGTTDTTFNPGAKTNRGMIVTILWRMENEPKASKEMTFTDVKDGRYYRDAVAWASEKGIVGGYSAEQFAPENDITREQLAVILHNYASYKGYNIVVSGTSSRDLPANLSAFSDAGSIHKWGKDAMSWANAEGLIKGSENNLLDPAGAAQRSQVAAILQRFVENIVK